MSHLIPLPATALPADEPFHRLLLHHAVAPVRRRHRHLIISAGRWALARGVSLPADHVALWVAAAEQTGCAPTDAGTATARWRASEIPDLLATITVWCRRAGCPVPAEIPEVLWHLFGFLAETNRLHPSSDALDELRAAVVVFAGFDRFRPHPLAPPAPTAA